MDTRIKLFRNNHMISVFNLNVMNHFRRSLQISPLLAAILNVCKITGVYNRDTSTLVGILRNSERDVDSNVKLYSAKFANNT